jgi:hypothetical protein
MTLNASSLSHIESRFCVGLVVEQSLFYEDMIDMKKIVNSCENNHGIQRRKYFASQSAITFI